MTNQIAIVGAGGLGREVLALLRALPNWQVIGFFDDGIANGTVVGSEKVLGGKEALLNWAETLHVVVAIGDPIVKKKVCDFLSSAHQLIYPTIIHPQAIILDSNCAIGKGSILTAGCVLTTDIRIGEHVLVNLNATIGHDSVVENYSSIMPGVNLAGAVHIGEGTLVGSGTNVLGGVTIGKGCVIGAGAVVNQSLPDQVVAVGVPVRVIKRTV